MTARSRVRWFEDLSVSDSAVAKITSTFKTEGVRLDFDAKARLRPESASSGHVVTIDTQSGFPDVVVIKAAPGLAEDLAQAGVAVDQYMVFKRLIGKNTFKPIIEKLPAAQEKNKVYASSARAAGLCRFVLNDEEILRLASWAHLIEKHDRCPVSLEWVRDGETGELFVVGAERVTLQARGETRSPESDIPETRTRVMVNMSDPAEAMKWWRLPCEGIGIVPMEAIINTVVKVHPLALAHFDCLQDETVIAQIEELSYGYGDKAEYFVEHLAAGLAKIAATRFPDPVIVRMSDFKTNEYAHLIGGQQFETKESTPLLGFRGASRYASKMYKEGFELECRAIRRVREEMGLSNIIIMIPFSRTLEDADQVLRVLAEYGLKRGENGLQIYVMAEIPSNILLAEKFAHQFDGFSIGISGLAQLVLGAHRDSTLFLDERSGAVKLMIQNLVKAVHRAGSKVCVCGQTPGDYLEMTDFLVEMGIDSISLNPENFIKMKKVIAEKEQERRRAAHPV